MPDLYLATANSALADLRAEVALLTTQIERRDALIRQLMTLLEEAAGDVAESAVMIATLRDALLSEHLRLARAH